LHHQWLHDVLRLERGPDDWLQSADKLREMGHSVTLRDDTQGAAHSIWIDPKTGERTGVADWRRGGVAAGE
jgi:gamma-glutamyltranspeptidase/glutathione hydrolase